MQVQYSFITKWQINAPLAEVWDAIYNSEEWPGWWKGCIKAEQIEKGNALEIGTVNRYTWKGYLPYKITFDLRITDRQDYNLLQGIATGDLTGTGTWLFKENGAATDVIFYWNVQTCKKWMNLFSFILKPVFKLNHNYIMRNGAAGLSAKLSTLMIKASNKTEFTAVSLLGI